MILLWEISGLHPSKVAREWVERGNLASLTLSLPTQPSLTRSKLLFQCHRPRPPPALSSVLCLPSCPLPFPYSLGPQPLTSVPMFSSPWPGSCPSLFPASATVTSGVHPDAPLVTELGGQLQPMAS